MRLLFPGELTPAIETRATGAAQEIVAVVNARLPDAPPGDRMAWARVLFTWSRYESLWFADPRGWGDAGEACGVLQVHHPEKYIDGATCARVRADRRLGFRVGLEVMLATTAKCGSRGLGLSAYSSDGTCPTSVFPIVSRRCLRAGLTATCEVIP
jgi:hypothetical protein